MHETGSNFLAAMQHGAAANLESPSLMDPEGDVLTYSELFDLTQRIAAVLADASTQPGDRVVALVDKSAAAVALYLACLGAGAVHVPLNPSFTPTEVDYFIDDCEPSVIITTTERAPELAVSVPKARVLTLDANGTGTLIEAAETASPLPVVKRDGDDLAALVYTSGTTGRPKGAMVTHSNLRHNAEALRSVWRFSPDDVLLHSLPIFHVHGLFVALHCAMLGGIPIHFLHRFDIDQVISLIPRSTVMMGVPTQYSRLMSDSRFDAELCSGMRLFTSGSAPLTTAAFDAFAERTGHQLCERYGMSEAGIITSNPVDGTRVAGTVGFPLNGYEVRVSDKSGSSVDADINGMVEIRGPHLCSGYWRKSEATQEATRLGGWFTTGDIGRLDNSGRLTLEGRAGDMIISGGENIHPMEIEAVLDRVDCVQESAVVGITHPEYGEAVVAIVVPAKSAELDHDDIDRKLNNHLVRFKHPKAIEVVPTLPRNAMGKVLKNELRIRFAHLFDDNPT